MVPRLGCGHRAAKPAPEAVHRARCPSGSQEERLRPRGIAPYATERSTVPVEIKSESHIKIIQKRGGVGESARVGGPRPASASAARHRGEARAQLHPEFFTQ